MTALSNSGSSPYLPASTPRSADVVLYLDLDGVVHHEKVLWHPSKGIFMSPYEAAGHALFEWVPILEAALEPYPAVALVLSSTWCIRPGYSATLKRLPPSLRARFIGGTYHKRVHGADPWNQSMFRSMPRGVQVQEDARRRKPRQWLALDDDVQDWPDVSKQNLITCEGGTGLSDPEVQRELREKLQRCHTALAR
ncbi:HAD domain-containing protein [Acidovorax sp. DW039]|uniref:HAD domain-containing protein n=1 Tax=Acidovorax sp. DW039 TaxID=3095606 RepID=UPI0030D1076D